MTTVIVRSLTVTALALTLLLGGCAPDPAASAPPTAQQQPSHRQEFPLVIHNCGVDVTFSTPPKRVLAIKSTSIEMLLALGLESRIVGTAFSDGPVSAEWDGAAGSLSVVSDRLPALESVLDLAPDLVFAGWESNVTAEGVGDRSTLSALGVNAYVSPSACTGAERPRRLRFDDVFADIEEVGRIFGVPERAAALTAAQRTRLDAVTPSTRALTALWYSSGSEIPYVGGGTGAPQMILDAAGIRNIAENIDQPWASLSWESIVDAEPDVIVLVDSSWGSVRKKISVLESNPATASLRAVVGRRYLILPFPAGEAGVRNVEAVESLIEQLDALP